MLGYNTKDPRKGSLLKLNDCLVLVVVPKGGTLDPHWNWEVRLPTHSCSLTWLVHGYDWMLKNCPQQIGEKRIVVCCGVATPASLM